MCRSRLYCVGVLLCALVAAGQPPEAAAQIGKFKKVIGNKAADAAVQTTADGAKNSACIPNRPPVVIESFSLTAAQMAKINAGLDAEIAAAPAAKAEVERQQKALEVQQTAYDTAYADFDKRNGPWNDCARQVADADVVTSDSLNQRTEALGDGMQGGVNQDMEKLGEKAQAAAQRVSEGKGTAEDRKTLAEFQQVMAGIQGRAGQVTAASQEAQKFKQEGDKRVEAKCGKRPEAPTQPSTSGSAEGMIHQAGAKAAGVPASTWTEWREQQIGLAMSNTVIKPGNGADAMNQQIQATRQKICAMKKAGVPI